jgi:hypothetical protein
LECEKTPIDNSNWNSGKKSYTFKERILLFLEANPDKAFSLKEIIEGMGYSLPVVMENYGDHPASQFREVLEDLAEENFVEIRSIRKSFGGQELYYKAISKAKNAYTIPAST